MEDQEALHRRSNQILTIHEFGKFIMENSDKIVAIVGMLDTVDGSVYTCLEGNGYTALGLAAELRVKTERFIYRINNH